MNRFIFSDESLKERIYWFGAHFNFFQKCPVHFQADFALQNLSRLDEDLILFNLTHSFLDLILLQLELCLSLSDFEPFLLKLLLVVFDFLKS